MTRLRNAVATGAVTIGLLVTVGVASRGRPLESAGWSVSTRTGTILMAVAFGAVSALIVALAVESHRPGSSARRRLGVGDVLLALTLVAAVATASYGLGRAFRSPPGRHGGRGVSCVRYEVAHGRPTSTCAVAARASVARPAQHGARRESPSAWLAVGGIAGLLAGGAALLRLDRRRPTVARPAAGGERGRAVADALRGVDDLRRDPDARRAIVAAYVRMESALAAAGLPRLASESPREFLLRSLRRLDASADAACRLTELFRFARFSQHTPAVGMRDEAVDALLAIRDELEARRGGFEPPTRGLEVRRSVP